MKTKVFSLATCALAWLLTDCKKADTDQPKQPAPVAVVTKSGNEYVLTLGSVVYKTGYRQTSSNNQDAYVQKVVDGREEWKKFYDTSPDDSKGVALNFADNRLYVAFICTGGNTSFKATAGAFQTSYGEGGGPKITFLARINPDDGALMAGTFLGAKLDNGKTNTFYPDDKTDQPIAILPDTQVQLQAIHAYDNGDGRLTAGNKDSDCQNSGGKWKGVFNEKMALVSGDCF